MCKLICTDCADCHHSLRPAFVGFFVRFRQTARLARGFGPDSPGGAANDNEFCHNVFGSNAPLTRYGSLPLYSLPDLPSPGGPGTPTSSAGLLQQLQQQQQQQALTSAFDAALSAHLQTTSSGLLPARNFSADATFLAAAAAAAASQPASVQTSADSNVRIGSNDR